MPLLSALSGWDHELYYSEEPQEGKTYARHAGFVEADSSERGISSSSHRDTAVRRVQTSST